MLALVTGFGPFLDVTVNPAGLIAMSLDGRTLAQPVDSPVRIASATLPVAYTAAAASLRALLADLAPDLVVLLGVARSPDYRLESGASPYISSPHPDATGLASEGRLLGDRRLVTTRPVGKLAQALQNAAFDARPSDDCGGYVCNSTYHAALALRPDALFIHIPPSTDAAALATGRALVETLLPLLADITPGTSR